MFKLDKSIDSIYSHPSNIEFILVRDEELKLEKSTLNNDSHPLNNEFISVIDEPSK